MTNIHPLFRPILAGISGDTVRRATRVHSFDAINDAIDQGAQRVVAKQAHAITREIFGTGMDGYTVLRCSCGGLSRKFFESDDCMLGNMRAAERAHLAAPTMVQALRGSHRVAGSGA